MEKPDLYVVARFLDIMYRNGSGMKKTNIQMLLGVNYPRFMEYLDWLLKHDLVQEKIDEDKTERIMLTPKGIDSYHRLVDWIKETLNGVKLERESKRLRQKILQLREREIPSARYECHFLAPEPFLGLEQGRKRSRAGPFHEIVRFV